MRLQCRDSLTRATQTQLTSQTEMQRLKADFDQMNAAFKQNMFGAEEITSRAGSLKQGEKPAWLVLRHKRFVDIGIAQTCIKLHDNMQRLRAGSLYAQPSAFTPCTFA